MRCGWEVRFELHKHFSFGLGISSIKIGLRLSSLERLLKSGDVVRGSSCKREEASGID
jgi:hypothetical protein